jgi:hypothetical protein
MGDTAMQPIAEALSSVTLGAPAQFRNLTVIPLFAPEERAPGYVLLDDALARKLAHVTEVSESGSVPELLFVNDAEDRVLLIDGEELVGARQNRILNVSILVGGRQKVVIPVSCVEQGRWHYRSRHFESAERALFAKARAKKMQHVSASLRRTGTYDGNQDEIWSDISSKAASLSVHSDTEAMSDIYEQRRSRIEDYVAAFAPQAAQNGAVFAIDGRIVGLELFDAAATFRKLMAKLVRSYAMDAIEDAATESRPPVEEVVRRFLDDMQVAAVQRFPALGVGEDLRIESATIAGGALAADDRIVHLCAFQVEAPAARPIGRIARIDFDIPAFLRRPSRST